MIEYQKEMEQHYARQREAKQKYSEFCLLRGGDLSAKKYSFLGMTSTNCSCADILLDKCLSLD